MRTGLDCIVAGLVVRSNLTGFEVSLVMGLASEEATWGFCRLLKSSIELRSVLELTFLRFRLIFAEVSAVPVPIPKMPIFKLVKDGCPPETESCTDCTWLRPLAA